MKGYKLHFNAWHMGGCGMANTIMGLQIAVILSYLTKRELYFYHLQKFDHSEKDIFIDDLFECEGVNLIKGNMPEVDKFPVDNCVYCYEDLPNSNFANGREIIDFKQYNQKDIGSDGHLLEWYSGKVFFKDRHQVLGHMKNVLKPKQKYRDIAHEISRLIRCTNSIHIRRGDFLSCSNRFVQSPEQILEAIKYFDGKVAIHTDETDENFFNFMNRDYVIVDKIIEELCQPLSNIEKAFISLLVASTSTKFIGNYGSTFSGLIHQMRMLNLFTEKFVYSGAYSWNGRNDFPWVREYEECGFWY